MWMVPKARAVCSSSQKQKQCKVILHDIRSGTTNLAQTVVGSDDNLLRVAGDGVPREHDTGGLGVNHLLNHDAHPRHDGLPVLPAVLHRLEGVQGGAAPPHRIQDFGLAPTSQKALFKSSKSLKDEEKYLNEM